jgi:hypothetical protein
MNETNPVHAPRTKLTAMTEEIELHSVKLGGSEWELK